MKKSIFLVAVIFCLISEAFWAQENTQTISPYLDPDSKIAQQTVPFYEGVDSFREKIEKIRKEEGREPLGLVLCGGSARAFCHVGALKAMEENGIVPDFIIANSMGAIIGSLYAYGFSPEKIEEVLEKISLSQYFEMVMPVHGGMISVRKYEAFVDSLLGGQKDLKDSMIPILLLSEDLDSKRQIWFGEGDFAQTMDAAFAMSFFMEPVDYTLSDGTKVKLIDSGTIDIAGLKVARSFSENLIVSTAFYDVDVDLNNPIVILNRTFSIGKERTALKDLLEYKPLLIRNDVEHFSFMDFQKAKEITQVGYDSAAKVMPYLLKTPHGKNINEERRKETALLADEMIIKVQDEDPMNSLRPYIGAKLWPVFGIQDYPDSYLYDYDGLALSVFGDFSSCILKGQVTVPFTLDQARADLYFKYNPSSLFSFETLNSYGVGFNGFEDNSFLTFNEIQFCPKKTPAWFKGFFVTGEAAFDEMWNPDYFIASSGLKFNFGNKLATSLYIKPFGYVAGEDFKNIHPGAGAELQGSLILFKYFGLGEYGTIRYSKDAQLLSSDFYRGKKTDNKNDLVASAASEIYFYTPSTGFTFGEFVIFQQLKAGAFLDYSWTGQSSFCTGGFLRTNLSLVGLADYIMEAGGGYDLNTMKPFAYFQMKNRM